jgi:thiosulfate reductase cytochrome b subunit
MISNATKRTILRWFHLILTIPILGYIYGEPSQVQQYANTARYIFVPVLILSGYWMYAGVVFAVIGVGLWLAAIHFLGFGVALLSQIALFIARRIWLGVRARAST